MCIILYNRATVYSDVQLHITTIIVLLYWIKIIMDNMITKSLYSVYNNTYNIYLFSFNFNI